jgi:hypothetical protein
MTSIHRETPVFTDIARWLGGREGYAWAPELVLKCIFAPSSLENESLTRGVEDAYHRVLNITSDQFHD